MADAVHWLPVGEEVRALPGEVALTLSCGPSQRQRHQEERRRHAALHPAVLQDRGKDGRGGDEAGGERRGEERCKAGEGLVGGVRSAGWGESRGEMALLVKRKEKR